MTADEQIPMLSNFKPLTKIFETSLSILPYNTLAHNNTFP